MGPRLLFLDFDGVLHPNLCPDGMQFCRMPALAEAIEPHRENLRIVVSSSWRFHYPLEKLVRQFSPSVREMIVGATGPAVVGRHARFREIEAFLAKGFGASEWRALDDCAWEFPEGCPQPIHCNGGTGMEDAQLDALRLWLGTGAGEGRR